MAMSSRCTTGAECSAPVQVFLTQQLWPQNSIEISAWRTSSTYTTTRKERTPRGSPRRRRPCRKVRFLAARRTASAPPAPSRRWLPAPCRRRRRRAAALLSSTVRSCLPENVTCSAQAVEAVGECVHEFLRALSSESSAVCEADAKKIISPEHIVKALRQLEFAQYADRIDAERERLKANAPRKRGARGANTSLSAEELERQQKALFDAARAAAGGAE